MTDSLASTRVIRSVSTKKKAPPAETKKEAEKPAKPARGSKRKLSTKAATASKKEPAAKKVKREAKEALNYRSRALGTADWTVIQQPWAGGKTFYMCRGCFEKYETIQGAWDHRESLKTKCRYEMLLEVEDVMANWVALAENDNKAVANGLEVVADFVKGSYEHGTYISWRLVLQLCAVFNRADIAIAIEREYKQAISASMMDTAFLLGSTSFFKANKKTPVHGSWPAPTAGKQFGEYRAKDLNAKVSLIHETRMALLLDHFPRRPLPSCVFEHLESLM